MMIYERPLHDTSLPGPGSPPGMTASKSSKSSSLASLPEEDSALADANHFEEIGLDDPQVDLHAVSDLKSTANPYSRSISDLRSVTKKPVVASTPRLPQFVRDTPRARPTRDFSPSQPSRPTFPPRSPNGRVASMGLLSDPVRTRNLGPPSRSQTSLSRHRSPSPGIALSPRDPALPMKPRRSSWQSNRDRKSAMELELECDEDDGDEIPDGLILDNVPLSPRPPSERIRSQPPSKSPSPERAPKERIRSVGNGTPPVATAQGCLRSPTWKTDSAATSPGSTPGSRVTSPVLVRQKSWTTALNQLNAEAKALTEKLEEHAEEIEKKEIEKKEQQLKSQRASTGSLPTFRRRSEDSKPRVKSALPELPPLRRSNIMIDPLPISKEKEAVLSRTRPSWLPPKDPAEERRHLREYQKMMQQSLEAERKREAAKRAKSETRDVVVDSVMQIWERDIIPRWNEAIHERRTRDLWWKGIAPRSRGLVWPRAIGNDLGLTKTSFEAALNRAREVEQRVKTGHGTPEDMRAVNWFSEISRDVRERTWPDLRIFQPGGPLHQSLLDVLRAYAMYRSDIGYVPGCNTIAALLLLNLPTPTDAFISLANVLNRGLPVSFFSHDVGGKTSAYNLLLQNLAQKSPTLHEHLTTKIPSGSDLDRYLNPIFTGLFTRHLALDEVTRLWDVYVFEGDALLIRAGVAYLLQKEMALLGTKTVAEVREVLGTAPDTGDGRAYCPKVMGGNGEEEKWMQAVRDAGKV